MPITRRYQCPDCESEFTEWHQNRDEPPPNFCPKCGNNMSAPPEQLVPFIKIGTHRGSNPDKLYRAMERASEDNQVRAAEQLGVDVSDMSAMKITDMKDGLREGDTAAKLPPPKAPIAVQNFQHTAQAQEYARSTQIGPYAGAGMAAMQGVTSSHRAVAQQVTAAGQVNKA